MMNVIQRRARDSGTCPPSLLTEDRLLDEGNLFEAALLKVLDANGFHLLVEPETQVATNFVAVMEKVESVDKILGMADVEVKKRALDFRRCVVLSIVGSTPRSAASLARVLSDGYLSSVKLWLDGMLASPEGSVDLLLHLLSSIVNLPVTKSVVKESGMGKAIGSVEKHHLIKGTPNEAAVNVRVQQIKDSWHASVKERRQIEDSDKKREAAALPANSPITSKRVKVEGSPQSKPSAPSLLSNILKKVSSNSATSSDAKDIGNVTIETVKAESAENGLSGDKTAASLAPAAKRSAVKKSGARVKWADHFGGKISVLYDVEGEDDVSVVKTTSSSFSESKSRDRLREKELLAKAKKSKLMDDDDDYDLLPKSMQTTTSWRAPSLIPERLDVTPVQLVSTELTVQDERMKSVAVAIYVSDSEIPESPAPLSVVEQALDMTSQASAIVAPMPFFVPPQAPPVAVASIAPSVEPSSQTSFHAAIGSPQPSIATVEVVQSLGLPLFLVGQSVQALQTLAQSPGLLSTLVDVHGMYDQPRLMQLVQTLSGTGRPAEPAPYQPAHNIYAPAQQSTYGDPSALNGASMRGGPRGGKSDDGNLYVTGFGAGTTESDLIAAFSPYVRTDEVVLKGTFAFVNTSDPINAQRARESLTGTLVGGMPIRISGATRKPRDNQFSAYGAGANVPSFNAPIAGGYAPPLTESQPPPPPMHGVPPQIGYVHPNVDTVRDDRGNPATKNLFVAGYGMGTTEQQLRDLVGQFAIVTGVVSKGTFAFVNTSDRSGAVLARENLGGTTYNNGVLRINFAKETGRLGTSFDLTYGPNTGPNANRPPPRGPASSNMSYYGNAGY